MTTPLSISLAGRDLLRISDLAPAEAEQILDLALDLKADPRRPLAPGATLGLYFSKHSTRTRVSFSVAMAHLGGTAIALSPDELQISRGESLPDTARALSRYVDALAVRTHAHEELEAWAEWASVPVINALTADEHPCQALADALTIRDRLGALDGVRVGLGRRRLQRARLPRRARQAARLPGRLGVPARLRGRGCGERRAPAATPLPVPTSS